ncbi:MAG: methionyl-tRNA formyltransferase [Alphaproteobacteria bacterium]
MSLRIVFMGTPDFAVPALKALHESGHEIIAVYSQPPRPKGRGQQVQKSPVHVCAEENGIPVFHPKSLKSAEAQDEFKKLNADVAVVAAYGLILPKAVLDAPKYGCINIHASLLPRWRGASPIQHAIWSGDSETGISLMQMDEGLDTGPVIAMERVAITDKTTSSSLHDELATLGGKMIVNTVNDLAKTGALKSTKQDDDSTYAPMLKKENGRINWTLSAAMIDRQVRALNPWPGAWAEFEGKRIRILAAELSPAKGNPGEILDRKGYIGHGLKILKVQPEGKNAMDFTAAVNGGYLKVGGIFT